MVNLVQIEVQMRSHIGAFNLSTYSLGLLQVMHVVLSLWSKQAKRGYPFEILGLHLLSVHEMCLREILLAHDATAINYEFTGRLALHYIMFFDGEVRDIRDMTTLNDHFGALLYMSPHVPALACDDLDLANSRDVSSKLA